jgi:hypothetical protein
MSTNLELQENCNRCLPRTRNKTSVHENSAQPQFIVDFELREPRRGELAGPDKMKNLSSYSNVPIKSIDTPLKPTAIAALIWSEFFVFERTMISPYAK